LFPPMRPGKPYRFHFLGNKDQQIHPGSSSPPALSHISNLASILNTQLQTLRLRKTGGVTARYGSHTPRCPPPAMPHLCHWGLGSHVPGGQLGSQQRERPRWGYL